VNSGTLYILYSNALPLHPSAVPSNYFKQEKDALSRQNGCHNLIIRLYYVLTAIVVASTISTITWSISNKTMVSVYLNCHKKKKKKTEGGWPATVMLLSFPCTVTQAAFVRMLYLSFM